MCSYSQTEQNKDKAGSHKRFPFPPFHLHGVGCCLWACPRMRAEGEWLKRRGRRSSEELRRREFYAETFRRITVLRNNTTHPSVDVDRLLRAVQPLYVGLYALRLTHPSLPPPPNHPLLLLSTSSRSVSWYRHLLLARNVLRSCSRLSIASTSVSLFVLFRNFLISFFPPSFLRNPPSVAPSGGCKFVFCPTKKASDL